MSDLGNKEVFAKNLKFYMEKYNKTRQDISRITNVPYTTVSSWCKALYYPRIDKIEMLANYFNILKSDLVENKDHASRSDSKYYMCPVYGRISAGDPNWAEEYIEGRIPIDVDMMNIFNPEEYFFLKVNGESMNILIKNGAFALIHKQDIVDNGDVAVVLVDDQEATLKIFNKEDNVIILSPNSSDDSFKHQIYTEATNIKVLGKYVGKMEFNN